MNDYQIGFLIMLFAIIFTAIIFYILTYNGNRKMTKKEELENYERLEKFNESIGIQPVRNSLPFKTSVVATVGIYKNQPAKIISGSGMWYTLVLDDKSLGRVEFDIQTEFVKELKKGKINHKQTGKHQDNYQKD